MNRARKGRAFEWELRKLLEVNGYSVMRGASSKGSVFGEKADLIATKRTTGNTRKAYMLIIQCKIEGNGCSRP